MAFNKKLTFEGLQYYHSKIKTLFSNVNKSISDETTRATTKENEIANNLTSEISRAKETEETLKSRIDTITSLPEGSTTGDAELQDIRVKADGTTATSAGNAVREQFSELKSDIDELGDDLSNSIDTIKSVFDVSENIYNPNAFRNKIGICIARDNGEEYKDSSTTNYITTDYYPTDGGDIWRFYRWNQAETSIHELEVRVHWYDSNKNYISGSIINGTVTAPEGVSYIRFSENFHIQHPELKIMVTRNYAFGLNGYQYYGEIKRLKEPYLPKDKKYEIAQRHGTLHSGESWIIENNNIMARKVFTLSGIISSFSSIEMGHGTKTNSPSSWIVVDNNNIEVYSTPSQTVTLAHGLTIRNTIQLCIEVDVDYKAKITLVSNGEKYTTEQDWDGNIGNIFVNSINTVLLDCDVSWTCKDYTSPIWAYGDSYFGMTNNARWMTHLLNNGYGRNMLIDGFPGRASDDAYNSLISSLKYGKPKYILWAMGMNNPDNDSSVNQSWNKKFNAVKELCAENDITLIACTIPNTPIQFNSYKNNIIRDSGIRYIDFAKCVGGEHMNDSWYEGMLSTDNIHPTEKGAITLYLQALADFPELISEK